MSGTSLVGQMVKHLPTMWETWVQSLGWEDPLEKEMATHSSTLAWKIPWTEERGGASGKEPAYQCRRPKRRRFSPWVGKIPWRRKWQSIPVLLPGKSHGQRSVVGYSPWGRKESDMTERLHFLLLFLLPVKQHVNLEQGV